MSEPHDPATVRDARLSVAVQQIGDCLTQIGLLQNARPQNDATVIRGNIAAGLERAAAYVLGLDLGEYHRTRAENWANVKDE